VVDTFFIGVCFDELHSARVAELFDKYTKAFDISKDGRKLIYCLWSGLCSPVAAGLRCMGCANRGERSPLAHRGKRPRHEEAATETAKNPRGAQRMTPPH